MTGQRAPLAVSGRELLVGDGLRGHCTGTAVPLWPWEWVRCSLGARLGRLWGAVRDLVVCQHFQRVHGIMWVITGLSG